MSDVMLTTTDNPYNPFLQFEEWDDYDQAQGYYTCAYLSRIANVSESLTPQEYENELNNAIDEILMYNILGIYKKVSRKDFE